jgi:hypothetical protein
MFYNAENIQIIIYVLIGMSVLVVILLISWKWKNNKKSRKGTPNNTVNMVEKDQSQKKVNIKENGKLLNNEIKEYDKSDFKFNLVSLLLNNKKKIVNPWFHWDYLFTSKDFFLWLQRNLNLLVKSWVYEISENSLYLIKKSIWKMNLDKILDSIHKANVENGISDVNNREESLSILKQLIILTLKNWNFKLFLDDDKNNLNIKITNVKRVFEKIEKNIPLDDEDLLINEKAERETDIIDEVNSISNWFKFDLLGFDHINKELEIKIDNLKDLFSIKLYKLVKYYKEKKVNIKIFI